MLDDVNQEGDWLVPYLLAVWQMVSRFSERVLPFTGLDERSSEELLNTLEVSPPDALTKKTSAGAGRGAAEQWSAEGMDTASPTRPNVKEGPEIDVTVAEIFPVIRKEVQIKVPRDTVWGSIDGTGSGNVRICELLLVGTANKG